MSGIAEVLVNQGFEVSGSDISENLNIERLRKLECQIVGHSAENINGASIVVIFGYRKIISNLLKTKKKILS